jgi:hypothetical protein
MTSKFEFSERDTILRKQWLRCSLLVYIFFPILTIVSLKIFFLLNSIETNFWLDVAKDAEFIIINLIFFAIAYNFAYIKCGTKWLTWWLVTGPLSFILSIGTIFKMPLNSLEIGFWIFDIFIYSWWYVSTWKLRRINRKIQLYKKFPDCLSSINILLQSETVENLNQNFSDLLTKFPILEPILSEVYQSKKTMLLGGNEIATFSNTFE